MLSILFGVQNSVGMTANTIHLDDIAMVHIKSLDFAIDRLSGFRMQLERSSRHSLGRRNWDCQQEFSRGRFSKAYSALVASTKLKSDASRTEEVFGFKFKSFEKQMVNIAGWYAELAAGENAN